MVGCYLVFALAFISFLSAGPAVAATISGQVIGGGAAVVNSTVTLWAATAGAPSQLGQARTDVSGRYTITTKAASTKDASLYLVAKGGKSAADKSGGDNPAIALLSVVGQQAAGQSDDQ